MLAGGYFFLSKDKTIFVKETSMYKAVPVSAPVFVELNAIKSIPFNNPLVKELISFEEDILFLTKVATMDSLIQNNKEIQNGLRNESLVLAFDFVGESNVFPVIICKASSRTKQKHFEKFLSLLYPSSQYSYSERDYSTHSIKTIRSNQNKSSLHFCFSDGLFIASPKALLIEKCLRQLNNQSITENIFFSEVNNTITSQSKISWYFNHQTFPELASLWLNANSKSNVNEFQETIRRSVKNNFNGFRNFAAWSELDLNLSEEEFILNGVSTADDSLNHFLSVFDGQHAVRFQADKLLPGNTSFFTSYSLSNKSLFFKNLEEYYSHSNTFYNREDRIKKIEKGFRVKFKKTFEGFVKDEIIVATTTIPVEVNKKSTLFVLTTDGSSELKKQFNDLMNTYAKRRKVEFSKLKSEFKADDENSFIVYNFPYPSFPEIWLGKPFELVKARYAIFYKNNLVFSNTEQGLQNYLLNMVSESSLNKNARYSRFKDGMKNRANINSYINVNAVYRLKDEIFNSVTSKKLENYEASLRKFEALSWQIALENNIAQNSIYLSLNKAVKSNANTTWQASLGSNLVGKPQLLINHRDVNNKEIIVQDSEYNLNQINKDGIVNWSVPIEGIILSKIHQIDFLKNGRLQYLFNTKGKLYLIDRNGNNVSPFPIRFEAPATNGVSVFDYDRNRKYRFFVALENKKVVAYDNTGRVLSGWKFNKTDNLVSLPIQHFRIDKRDYIVFKDKSKIYIQNRKGETRIDIDSDFENSINPLVLNRNNIPKIITTDISGKVYYIYFDGKIEERKTAKFGNKHFFKVEDLDNDGLLDFIFVDGKELKVLNEKGKKVFTKKFRSRITKPPGVYDTSSGEKGIGIVEDSNNRIHLFNSKGKLHDGFPLQGNSEFCIGKLSKGEEQMSLFVGNKTGDLFNYSLK